MSSEGSDIDLPSVLPKKINKKMPKSPSEDLLQPREKKVTPTTTGDPKRLTTKMMIHKALIDLKSRKGVSIYAIKKYLIESYSVDTEKMNYLIKKAIKTSVEDGSIVQIKGSGASGSFKIVPVKEKKKAKPKKTKNEKEDKEKIDKTDKPKKMKMKSKQAAEKAVKTKTKLKKGDSKEDNVDKLKKKVEIAKMPKNKKVREEKEKKTKVAKGAQTPSKKKAAMMKRKSIGSIIKPPKMKPKA